MWRSLGGYCSVQKIHVRGLGQDKVEVVVRVRAGSILKVETPGMAEDWMWG